MFIIKMENSDLHVSYSVSHNASFEEKHCLKTNAF